MARNGYSDFSDATVLDLVEHIYAAGSDPSRWPALADRFNQEVPGVGFGLGLVLMSDGRSVLQSFACAGYNPDSVRSLFEHYQSINPYEPLHAAIPVAKVVRATQLVTRDWLQRQVFYHEWLKPAGNLTHGASVVVAREARRHMRISIDIPERLGDLEAPCAQLLARLGPHLVRALELNDRLEAAAATDRALESLLTRIDGPAALLGPRAQVLGINARAEALARAGTLIDITPGNRLTFRKAGDETAFERALAAALGSAASDASCAFVVEGMADGPASAFVLPLRPLRSAASPLAGPQALLVIREAATAVTAPADLLRVLFRLTPAESAVVLQIAAGHSVAEAAEALMVSRTTARNQLAAAMTKMDVHRQAELVALVAGLGPRLDLGRKPCTP